MDENFFGRLFNRHHVIIIILASLLGLTLLVGIPFTILRWRGAQAVPAGFLSDDWTAEHNALYTTAAWGRLREPDEMTAPGAPLPVTYNNEALVPVSLSESVFYDPNLKRLTTGGITAVSQEHNYFFDIHTFRFDNINWPPRKVRIGQGPLYSISLDGPVMTLRLNRSSLAEILPGGIQLADPKEVYKTIIVVDPGHGGHDVGAETQRALYEKDIDLDIVLRLLDLGDDPDIWLLPTRAEDIFISLDDRYRLANRMGDYFISVHNNVDGSSSRSGGTVTYYQNHPSDKPVASEAWALLAQEKLVARLGTRDRGVVSSSDYRLLRNSVIPTVLTEIMFISNPGELERLMDPACRQEMAQALWEAITQLPPAREE